MDTKGKKKTVRNCILVVIFMAGFSFAMVPLYNVFCDVTGLNGKVDLSTGAVTLNEKINVDKDRVITVEFDVSHHKEMPWFFKPMHKTIKVHPGEVIRTAYYAQNTTKDKMTMQAIPSITPGYVAKYFKKVQCFCFSSQTLMGGQTQNLILRFYIDPKIPKTVKRLTLSYSLFDVTKESVVSHAHG